MTGKPTPGRCEVLTAGSSVYVTKDGVPIAKVSSLYDSVALARRFVVGWNAIVDAETAGYDGLGAVKDAAADLASALRDDVTRRHEAMGEFSRALLANQEAGFAEKAIADALSKREGSVE